MSKRIVVTGANGQLGSEIRELSSYFPDDVFTFITRQDLDLSDASAIQVWFENKDFDVIINCAAYTAVDKAETEVDLATAINATAVKILAQIAKQKAISLLHISTDYVFAGDSCAPYRETDATNPQGVYGQSKLDGELAMLAINPDRSVIIRTSWVYSRFGNNFVKTMIRLGKERKELNVIYDQVGTPTSAKDLALVLLMIIQSPQLEAQQGTEIFHYSNEGVCSWYDFAIAIFKAAPIRCKVNPIETKDYPTPAKRPHYSLLNKAKIKNTFNLSIPYWRDSLPECLEHIKYSKGDDL
ncbi:MAG: dTDP-4-dehydrorhamnose reductase [Methylococcales bacterium]|nr:MAG: dTDP-4-dehydrorhamnose reductase [Methylococcales bacterium]